MPRESALCRLRWQRTSIDVLIMPILSASDCQSQGVRACCEARRPSAASAQKTRRGPPSSWSIYMVSAAAHVELLSQAKWVCASTAQRTTSHFDCALRVLMLRHDHPWPRVQARRQRHSSEGACRQAQHERDYCLSEVGAKCCKVANASLARETMPTRSHCFIHHIKQLCGVLPA